MKFINKYKSPKHDNRKKGSFINLIILHYTAMTNDKNAIEYLSDKKNKVSSHFLINKKGDVFNLVNLNRRAWHAGVSFWRGETDINSSSIGIELDNSGCQINFERYPNIQILSLIKLLIYLKKVYKIDNHNILGHSDIAPFRKEDPGDKFPWQFISKKNIVNYPLKIKKNPNRESIKSLFNNNFDFIKINTLHMLSIIGYNVLPAKRDNKNFRKIIRAYQMHYRPKLTNGLIDIDTYELILFHFKSLNEPLT